MLFIFGSGFVFLFFLYICTIGPGVKIDEKIQDPSAGGAACGVVAFDASKVAEPYVSTPEMVTHGAKLF
ncbi:MAG: cytochrome c, partial [Pseudobdellovibrionaceae bacterium]